MPGQTMKIEKTVFVIMPFVKAPTRHKVQLSSFYENNIKKPIESADLEYNYVVRRSDETFNITDKIIKDLYTADVVIADLSGIHPNPNVMYELGVRLAISRKPVILIREEHQDNETVFDITGFYVHRYDPLNYVDLQSHIIEKLRRLESGEETYESPVLKVIQGEVALVRSALKDMPVKEQRDLVLRGFEVIARYLASAYGPRGSRISVPTQGERLMTRWGVWITNNVHSTNPLEAKGIEQAKLLANEIYRSVGDGSKTTVMFAYALMANANEALASGHHSKDIAAGIRKALNAAKGYIAKIASHDLSSNQLYKIASTASGDSEIASRAVELLEKVGPRGKVLVRESSAEQTQVELIENPQFERGYLVSDFVTDFKQNICVLDDCYILLSWQRVNSLHNLLPILSQAASIGVPLLIVADEVEGEALNALIVNNEKGVLKCAAVKAPGDRHTRLPFMQDLAVLVDAKIIDDGIRTLANVSISDLGQAKKVVIGKDTTTVIGGAGNPDTIEERAKLIQEAIQSTVNEFDRNVLESRLSILLGKKAVIYVGGTSSLSRNEEIYRTQSGLDSAISARDEGWVTGGGTTLLRMRGPVEQLLKTSNQAEAAGMTAFTRALQTPISKLVENANGDVSTILSSIINQSSSNIGFDAETGTIRDLLDAGIIDSAKMLRKMLEFACERVCVILETGTWDLGTTDMFAS